MSFDACASRTTMRIVRLAELSNLHERTKQQTTMTTINAFYQWRILVMNAEQTETVYESGVFTTQPAQWSKAELWAVHYGYARLERRTVDTKPFAGSIAFGEQCHADKWHTIAEIES